MFKLENGKKLMAKRDVYAKHGYKIPEGDNCILKEFFFDMDIEKGDESVHLMLFNETKEQAYHVEMNVAALDFFFTELKSPPIKEEYSMDKLVAAYDDALMTENGYDVKNEIASPTRHSTQKEECLYQPEIKSLIDEIEAFNKQTFKQCAINVALDTHKKEMFMQLTSSNA